VVGGDLQRLALVGVIVPDVPMMERLGVFSNDGVGRLLRIDVADDGSYLILTTAVAAGQVTSC
jgi:hypothetical protein